MQAAALLDGVLIWLEADRRRANMFAADVLKN